jgi:LmeA-like phospholipid-binding
MEFLTIFFSSLMTLIAPTGAVVDRVATNIIRSQFGRVESLQVRVDNAPSYQIIGGKFDRVRVAGRGLFPLTDLRLEALELETDPIALNGLRAKLVQPLQAGVKVVITKADINRALQSPTLTARLKNFGIRSLNQADAEQAQRYDILNPQVVFLPNGRLQLQVALKEQGYPDNLTITAEAGMEVVAGRTLRLVNPTVIVNGQPAPEKLVRAFADGANQRLDLRQFERSGITARILHLQIDQQQIQIAAFVQMRSTK